MLLHRKADPSPLPVPHRKSWYLTTAVTAVSLLAALWWAGAGRRAWDATTGPGWLQKMAGWAAQVFGGVGWLLTGGNGLKVWGARVACLILLGFALWAWRLAMLHHNAYKPGPVDVQELSSATLDGQPQPPVDDLTAQFRKQLSETELYAPTSLPAEAPAASFLDLLGDVNLEPAKLGTSLLRFTSQLHPRIAYRVSGVLAFRDTEPSFGLTVTITSYAIQGSRAETFWETSWEQAARKAGYWVVSALLPVTHASKKQPWRDWRGRNLPSDLFMAYQQARELGRDRKFDEVLDKYYQAVRYDPLNAYLRNQIGATQEKLGLHLDALETYYGVLNLGRQGTRKDENRLSSSPWNWRRFTYQRFLWRQPGVLQARYRFAVVLGTSELTANQWCKNDGGDARSTARKQIREALEPAFRKRYKEIVQDLASKANKRPEEWLEEQLTVGPADDNAKKNIVALVFQRASTLEMCRLAEDYPVARFVLRFRSNEIALSRSALRVNRDVWAPLRLVEAQKKAGKGGADILAWGSDFRWRWGVKRAATEMEKLSGECSVPAFKKAVRKAMLCRFFTKWPLFAKWQGHYNAACVYAVALKVDSCAAKSDELAHEACHELKEALRRAERGFVTLKRSWLLFEDPDLAKLRERNDFARFSREFYPHSTPDILPAPATKNDEQEAGPIDIEVTAYDRIFLESVGKAMERIWHHRSTRTPADLHVVSDWLKKEQQIWELVDIISASEARNWRNRRKLLQKVQEAADSVVQARIELPAVPEFDQVITSDLESKEWVNPNEMRDHLGNLPDDLDKALRKLHDHIREQSIHSPIKRSNELLRAVEHGDESGWDSLHSATIEPICKRYAAAWQAFSSQFSALLIDPTAPMIDFLGALDQLDRRVPLVTLGR